MLSRSLNFLVAMTATAAVLLAVIFSPNQIVPTMEIGSGPVKTTLVEVSFASGTPVSEARAARSAQTETIKAFHRDEPFNLLALAWEGDRDTTAFVRAKQEDGSWSDWYDMELISSPGSKKNGTEPAFLGDTTDVEVKATGDVDGISAVFIDGNIQAGIAQMANLDSAGMPLVVSRAGWGADESLRCLDPYYDARNQAVTLHHTAGKTNYTRAEAAAQVRGVYHYHAQTLGWCDIGYNVLVDRFGTLYEGRYGGLDRAVQGAHVGGFNTNNWSVSMLGDYSANEPSQAMLKSAAEIAGWKAARSGFDPAGQTSLRSGGFRGSRFPAGTTYNGPSFLGHRDLHFTECPGENTVPYWPQLRADAHRKYVAITNGTPDPAPAPDPEPGRKSSIGTADGSSGPGSSRTDTTSSFAGITVSPQVGETIIGVALGAVLLALAYQAIRMGLPVNRWLEAIARAL
ncbi:N-acetylmuramoyl-L-alanine amidase [Corynebacterium phocae]|uniref:N-acetylmuramoyl-L-alanine amidase n=2 Tax=Corynebacterium phocae TaxID=161895 RepID=UPI001FE93483|nr:N-acetylmuramoyl-L-alanine amidase [Corynebacterium phocae]